MIGFSCILFHAVLFFKKNFKSMYNNPERKEEIEMHCIKACNWIELNLCIVSFGFTGKQTDLAY